MAFILFAFFSAWHGVHYEDSSYRLYSVRQGVIYYKTTATNGSSVNEVIYFDHFGSRQAIQISAPRGTNLGPARVLQIDGLQYAMLDNSQCIKSKRRSDFSAVNIDFMKLDTSSVKKYGIKKIGTTFFLNRICNRYTLRTKDGVLNGEIIEWQRVPLSIKIRKNGILQETVASQIDILANISPNLFELPKKIQIIDATIIENH